MTPVFVDTGGWFGLLVPEDAHFAEAGTLFRRARLERRTLVTTDAVVFETYALLVNRARDGRTHAHRMLDDFEAGMATVVHVSEDDVAASIALVHSHRDKSYSLCDASSFVVMERLRIVDAIAFDEHFRQFGRINVLG